MSPIGLAGAYFDFLYLRNYELILSPISELDNVRYLVELYHSHFYKGRSYRRKRVSREEK